MNHVFQQQALSKQGLNSAPSAELLKPINVESVRIERGRETKNSETSRMLEIIVMVMLIFVALVLYGISVMRSVLEGWE